MFDDSQPMILRTPERQACQERYDALKRREPYKARLAVQAWTQLEDWYLAFGPHVRDIPWLSPEELRKAVFPRVSPMTMLMEVMEVPAVNGVHYGRENVVGGVYGLLKEYDMEALQRSVAIGWVSLARDHLIQQSQAA